MLEAEILYLPIMAITSKKIKFDNKELIFNKIDTNPGSSHSTFFSLENSVIGNRTHLFHQKL